jgi:putative transposase
MADERLPVNIATRVLDVSKSGYYDWANRSPSQRQVRHTWLLDQIQAVHTVSKGAYGAPRVHAELTLRLGIVVGHNTVAKLMRRNQIRGLPDVKRAKHQTPTAGDLVNRAFGRPGRDQLWVTDITEHPTREGKEYCAVVLGRVLPPGRGVVHRHLPDGESGHQGPGHGHP